MNKFYTKICAMFPYHGITYTWMILICIMGCVFGLIGLNEFGDASNRLQRKVEILTIEKSRLDILEEKFNRIEQQTKKYEFR